MPTNPRYGDYEYTSSKSGNDGYHECTREYGSGATQSHKSYPGGGYSYNNPDGSIYSKAPDGSSTFVTPKGDIHYKPGDQAGK